MHQEAEAYKDLFLQHGLSEEGLAELGQQIKEFDQAMSDAHAARRAHTGASRELQAQARDMMKLLHQLDGIVLYRYKDKPALLGAWDSARNLPWPQNVARKTKEEGTRPAA